MLVILAAATVLGIRFLPTAEEWELLDKREWQLLDRDAQEK